VTPPLLAPDLALLLAMLTLIAWHALGIGPLLLASEFATRLRLAWDLWRDPWLGYSPRAAWRMAGILAPMGVQVARRWRRE
jgi:hypothetical protein